MKIKIRNFKYIIFIFIALFIIYFKSVGLAYETVNQKDFSISLIKRKILYSKISILEKSQNKVEDNSKEESSNSFNINILNYIKQENMRDNIHGK